MQSRFLTLAVSCLLWAGLACAQININTASQEELDGLKGIGPAKAQAIVDYRQKNGPFKTPEDLLKVEGIGDKVLDQNKGNIRVDRGGAPAATGARPAAKPAQKQGGG